MSGVAQLPAFPYSAYRDAQEQAISFMHELLLRYAKQRVEEALCFENNPIFGYMSGRHPAGLKNSDS